MPLEFDFDEEAMNEVVQNRKIPLLKMVFPLPKRTRVSNPGIFLDLEKYLLQEKIQEQERIKGLKDKQQHIGQQIERKLAHKERKIRQLQDQQRQKFYEQCTFKPKTTIVPHKEKRKLNQFLNQQQQFIQKVQQKKDNLKRDLQKRNHQQTFHPKINKSTDTRRKNDKTTVFQRLYALKDKENEQDNRQQKVEHTYHPKITQKSKKMTRNVPIQDLLYGDALRRQQKARQEEDNAHQTQKSNFQKPINYNNEKYAAQKFLKQYYSVLENLEILNEHKMQYMTFNQVLKQLGFVQLEEENQNNFERSLIHKAYEFLEQYTPSPKNICIFLLAIIGIYHINPVNFESDQQNPSKQLILEQAEGRKIQKQFDLFKRNKWMSQANKKDHKSHEQKYSFHPKINKQSQHMAEKYRQHMLQQANFLLEKYPEFEYSIPQDGVISHTDLLVLNNYAKQVKMINRKEQIDKLEMVQCTFKPTTLSNSISPSMNNSKFSIEGGLNGNKKSLQLYQYYKNLQSKKQSMKVSRQEQDKELKQCTFAPNLKRPKIEEDTTNFKTKEVSEMVYRMKKGRQQYQCKKQFLQRGEKVQRKDQSIYKSFKEEQEECDEIPILILDVNLDDKLDRLPLFKGDETRLPEIARIFVQKHGLQPEYEQKLVELLQIELENVLMKIDEDEESENQDEQ